MIADEKAARQKTIKNSVFFMVFLLFKGQNQVFFENG